MRTNMRGLILSGIKNYFYSFTPPQYAFTKPTRVMLDWLFEEGNLNKRQRYYVGNVINKLLSQGLIREDKVLGFKLTRLGELALAKLDINSYEVVKPKKWDGKYRVIIFDIAEQKRKIRNELRKWLVKLGFVRLQNSVWVFPYGCEEVVALIKADYGVVGEVVYMTVESIENDQWLKEQFGLK